MTSRSTGDTEPVLAVPRALVLPDAARDRLRRQFDRWRPALGVAATIHDLAAGSSVTTAAERAAMAPPDAWTASGDLEVAGAVLLAPGVDHHVGERTVTIVPVAGAPDGPGGRGLLVDPGAASFDPLATATVPGVPDADARPPFRWRPVVLFLAARPDPERARLAARVADALADHDVEPRLAVHAPLEAPLRTRPVVPDEAAIAALRPDLVVALDPDAVAFAQQAPEAARSMVVAELDESLGDRIELVSWTVGEAVGRLRARLGPDAAPAAVAALVNRLCSGPIPVPPADGVEPAASGPAPVHVTLGDDAEADTDDRPSGPAAPRPTFGLADEPPPSAPDPRRAPHRPLLAGLTDHLLAGGWEPVAAGAPADLVLAAGALGAGSADRIVHVVEDAADATAVVALDRASGDGGPTRLAVVASGAVAAPLRAAGIRTVVVPVLRTRAELAARAGAHEHRVRPAAPTVAVVVDGPAGPRWDPATTEAVGRALEQVRAVQGELAVVVAGPGGTLAAELPAPLVDLAEPVTRARLDDPGVAAGWTAALWAGSASEPGRRPGDGPPTTLVALALEGVPVVMAAADATGLGAVADRSLAVAEATDATSWARPLVRLLDDEHRAIASARARRVGDALDGDAAAASVVARIVGWASEPPR